MLLLLALGPLLLARVPRSDAGRLDLVSAALSLGRRAGSDLRVEARRRARRAVVDGAVDRRRARRRASSSCDGSAADRAADRPATVPRPGVQRVAGRQHARHLRRVRRVRVHRPVPAARARAVAARGGPVDSCRSGAGFVVGSMLAPAMVRGTPGLRDGRRPAMAAWLRDARAGRAASRLAVLVAATSSSRLASRRVHADHGPDHGRRAAGASWRGRGDLGDRLRARRRARDRRARQRGHGGLSQPHGRDDSRGPFRCRDTRGARHARRGALRGPDVARSYRRRARRRSTQRVHARSAARRRSERARGGCAWPAMVVRWLASVDPGSSQPDLTPAK